MSKAWFPYNGRFSRRFDTIRAFTWKSGLSSKFDVLCLYQSSRSFMISWPGFRLAFPNAWAFSGTIEVIQNNRRKPDLKKSVFEYKLWYHLTILGSLHYDASLNLMLHLWIRFNKQKQKKEKICKQLDIITPCALSQEDDCHSSQRDFLCRHVNQVKPRSQAFSTCFSLGPLWALIPSRQVSKVWSLAHFVSEFVRATGLRERKWRGYYRGI